MDPMGRLNVTARSLVRERRRDQSSCRRCNERKEARGWIWGDRGKTKKYGQLERIRSGFSPGVSRWN